MVLTHPGPPVLLASWWTPEASGEARTTPLNRSQGPWTAHLARGLGRSQQQHDDHQRGDRYQSELSVEDRHHHRLLLLGWLLSDIGSGVVAAGIEHHLRRPG